MLDLGGRRLMTYTTSWLVEVQGSPWRIFFLEMNEMVFKKSQPIKQRAWR